MKFHRNYKDCERKNVLARNFYIKINHTFFLLEKISINI